MSKRIVTPLLIAGLVTGCSAPSTDSELAIGVGFETLIDRETDWAALSQQFDRAGVNGFSLAVGRPEWLGYPAPGAQDQWAAGVDKGTDLVREALDELDDGDRTVVLTVDALTPATIADDPQSAGQFANGTESESFPSATALYSGGVGKGITNLCADVAERYQPDRIALTELIGDAFFSPTDEELFTEMTGAAEFPRHEDGSININDDTLNDWQSQVITTVIERCVDAAAQHNVGVEMDARVNWEDPGANRHDSGHRYQDILDTGAHLTLWAYTGTGGVEASRTADLVEALGKRFDEAELARITVSVGLWGEGDEVLDEDYLAAALDGVIGGQTPAAILVTPVSLMGPAHWDVLTKMKEF